MRILRASALPLALATISSLISAGCRKADDPPVRMGFSAWPGWFPWQIAADQGFFEQAGVDVDLVWFDVYVDSLTGLIDGVLDANAQTLNDTISSVAADSDQVIVLVNDNSTGNDQCIVTADITTVNDLVGRTIAVEAGVVDHYMLLLALQRAGVDADDVRIVTMATDVAAQAFADGQYDGVCVFAPFTTTASARSGSHVLLSSADFPGAIPDYLVVSREMIDDRPNDVQGLVDAWWLTRDYMAAEPEHSIEIMAERAGVSTTDYETFAAGTTLFSLEQNLEALGNPPSECTSLGDDSTRYIECTSRDINEFLVNDAMITSARLSDAQLQAMWTDEFVVDYADRR